MATPTLATATSVMMAAAVVVATMPTAEAMASGNTMVAAVGTVSTIGWYVTSAMTSVQVMHKVPELVEVSGQGFEKVVDEFTRAGVVFA